MTMKLLVILLKKLCYMLLLLLLSLLSIIAYLALTSSGLNTSIKLARYFLPGKLTVYHLKGQLIHHIKVEQLNYVSDSVNLDLHKLTIHWHVLRLLNHQFVIDKLHVTNATITAPPQASTSPSKTTTTPLPHLPLDIILHNIAIDHLIIINNKQPTVIDQCYLSATLTNQQWQLTKLNATYRHHDIELQGHLKPVMPYRLTALLAIKTPDNLSLPGTALAGQLNIDGNFFRYHAYGHMATPVHLTIDGMLDYGQYLHTTIDWQQFNWPLTHDYSLTSDKGQLVAEGKLTNLMIHLNGHVLSPLPSTIEMNAKTSSTSVIVNSHINAAVGDVHATIVYNETKIPHIQGTLAIQTGNVKPITAITNINSTSQFSGSDLTTLTINSDTKARYLNQPVTINAHYQHQKLTAHANLGVNHLELQGTQSFPWQLVATLPNPGLLYPSINGLQTIINLRANLLNNQQGNLVVNISKGKISNPKLPVLPFEGGIIHANLTAKQLKATGQFILDANKKIALTLTLPNYHLGAFEPKQAIKAKANLTVNSLSFLNSISTIIGKIDGQLKAFLTVDGTLQKPLVQGELHLDSGQFFLPQLNIKANPLTLALQSHDQKWQANGTLVSAGRAITLQGKGDFYPAVKGLLTLTGDKVLIMNLPEYMITISPTLSIDFTPTSVKIGGDILIPNALIKPQTFTETISLSNDVTFVDDKKPSANPLNLDMNILINMGNEVKLAIKGLQGMLIGGIRLHQLPAGPMTAIGELDVRDGKYKAYGQDLLIDTGQLVFTGGLVDDPGIRLRAVRKFNNATNSFAGSNQLFDFNAANMQTLDFGSKTTVGIEVVGRLSAPKVQLFSIPSNLSQADILSMLLLGKPANQASQAGGQLLMTAVSALKLDSTDGKTQLLDQLKQNLGIDFNLANNVQYNQKTSPSVDNTSVVVGKSLFKRLYLSYSIGLTQADNNTLTLKYLLNKFFSIQVNASSAGNGIDFLYNREKD